MRESAAFYAKLGFKLENSFTPDGESEPVWAYLVSDHAQLMVSRASHPVDSGAQAVLFYAYFDNTPSAWDRLAAAGIECGPVEYPFWAAGGEFRVVDPDGYVVMVTHVGDGHR